VFQFRGAWRATLLSLGSTAGVLVASLAAYVLGTVILGRNLPREQFGLVTLWINAFNLLGAAALLGFPNAFLRHYTAKRLGNSKYHIAFWRLAFLSVLVAAGGAAIFEKIYTPPSGASLLLFAGATGLGLSSLPVTWLTIFKRITLGQAVYTLWRHAFLLAAVIIFVFKTGGSWQRVVGLVALTALGQVVLAILSLKRQPGGPESIKLRPMIPDAALMAVLFVASMFMVRLDTFFLPKLLSFDALGLYGAMGFLMLTGYGVVSLALGQVMNAKLANRETVPFRTVGLAVAVGGIGLGVCLALLEPIILPAVYGEDFSGDYRKIALLMAASGTFQVLYAIPSSRLGVLAPKRGLVFLLCLSLSCVALGAVLLVWFVPRWGLEGAALATATVWTYRFFSAWILSKTVPLKPLGKVQA
jgi:O-antigen/teichoic acid export membrane protein